jgi:hypothetical protein
MKSFLPADITTLFITLTLLIFIICLGFFITKIRNTGIARLSAWLMVIVSTAGIERWCNDEGAGYRMLAIILVMLFSIKVVVTVETYKNGKAGLSFVQWLAFVTGWFGMRPQIFESLGGRSLPGGRDLIIFGIIRILSGAALLMLAKWISIHYVSFYSKIIITGLLLAAISLILHFGILNISAGAWRFMGADTKTLFRSPLSSTSLSEFWGRRWNIAFSEMTAIAIYRPLKAPLGTTFATLLAFLFSGLLHEMAISLPVEAGFGLPLLYFLIHGSVMLVEREMEKRGFPISKHAWAGRTWVIFWLLLPLPLLFHKAFVKGIVWDIISR